MGFNNKRTWEVVGQYFTPPTKITRKYAHLELKTVSTLTTLNEDWRGALSLQFQDVSRPTYLNITQVRRYSARSTIFNTEMQCKTIVYILTFKLIYFCQFILLWSALKFKNNKVNIKMVVTHWVPLFHFKTFWLKHQLSKLHNQTIIYLNYYFQLNFKFLRQGILKKFN